MFSVLLSYCCTFLLFSDFIPVLGKRMGWMWTGNQQTSRDEHSVVVPEASFEPTGLCNSNSQEPFFHSVAAVSVDEMILYFHF
jgi:hypothetical protein